MKKILPLLLVIAVVAGVWAFASSRKSAPPATVASAVTPTAGSTNNDTASDPQDDTYSTDLMTGGQSALNEVDASDLDDSDQMIDLKPAAEAFKSADEALAAVQKAAKDYDDSILEQFTQPGDDCTWCSDFYRSVKSVLSSSDTPQDQKSYLAEILAISGRVENVQSLVDAIKNAKSTDEADLYSEALELSVGKDDVTKYLGDQLAATNETLREAAVAAITNQGSRLAAELLIKNTEERGDPDGYYSLGIGLGELIPDEETMPVLQDLMHKHNQYSHLAVKALINGGKDGLRAVFDELESSQDPEGDRKLLKDAIDHVNFEDGLEEDLRRRIETTKQPVVAEFAKQILDEFNQQEEEAGESTPAEPS